MSHDDAQREKRKVAFISVLAAVGLTTFKLVVGILTNSLGILAEAAHSGLDMAAAVMTYFAVRVSDKPADQSHLYGHGKVENLSALFETLLLLATSGWIIFEAVDRLFFNPEEVETSAWAFVVMIASIIIDINRSNMLYKAANKYNSQALEADALHFKTDIWSSAVVILGLVGVTLAENISGLEWMHKADAVAALIVALIVVYVSGELGLRTVSALLDSAPEGQAEKIQNIAESIKGVVDTHAVRVRTSGAHWFVDLHIRVDPVMNTSQAHALASEVERQIREEVKNVSDVVVHIEPAFEESSDWDRIAFGLRQIADSMGLGLHNLHVHVDRNGKHTIEVDLEISRNINLEEAHKLADDFETRTYRYWPKAVQVVTHLEPLPTTLLYPTDESDETLKKQVEAYIKNQIDSDCVLDIQTLEIEERKRLILRLSMPSEISLIDSHNQVEALKRQLLLQFPEVTRVIIHVEPTRNLSRDVL